jgi:hypothetical protein
MCEHTQTHTHAHTHTNTHTHISRSTTTHSLNIVSLVGSAVTQGSVDDGHVVLTIVAPREEATKFILGACPGETPADSNRNQMLVGGSGMETTGLSARPQTNFCLFDHFVYLFW